MRSACGFARPSAPPTVPTGPTYPCRSQPQSASLGTSKLPSGARSNIAPQAQLISLQCLVPHKVGITDNLVDIDFGFHIDPAEPIWVQIGSGDVGFVVVVLEILLCPGKTQRGRVLGGRLYYGAYTRHQAFITNL